MIGLVIFCLCYYLVAGLTVALGYHRCLTHRSFRLRKYFEYLIIFLGLPAGTPIQWVGNHRYHHMYVDQEEDPHSPVVNGFWYAHNGWYLNSRNSIICFLYAIAGPLRMFVDAYRRPITNQQYNYLAKDVAEVAFYRNISKPTIFRLCLLLHLLLPYAFVIYHWGEIGLAALWLCQIFIYNVGDGVNSLAHNDEQSEYGEHNKASNLPFLALLTFGDAFHADHHEFPASARLDIKKKGIDLGWIVILILKRLNLAYNIKTADNNSLKNSNDE